MICFRHACVFAFLACILSVKGQTITTRTLDLGSSVVGDTGADTSQAVVNGTPAVAYYNASETSLMFARNSAADGSGTWTITTVDQEDEVGNRCSLAVVDGKPAICYFYAGPGGALKYVRARDASGTSWEAPVYLAYTGFSSGHDVALSVVNGKPAAAFLGLDYDYVSSIMYVRALDATGTNWDASKFITRELSLPQGAGISLAVVNGRPAIAHYDGGTSGLHYVRALDADGTAWGTDMLLHSDAAGAIGLHASMTVINGNPAISYYDAGHSDLMYLRALDADGSNWGTPATLDGAGANVGTHTFLCVVNGAPAVSYYDVSNGNLKYIRAGTASGTLASDWGAPLTLDDTSANAGMFTSLAVVSGNPAVSYYDESNGNLKYVRASDATGTNWAAATIADAGEQNGNAGEFTAQIIVGGKPAIAYRAGGQIRYIRALDTAGTTWGPPVAVISDNTGGYYISMALVNGSPAIAYFENTYGRLMYVRAADAAGTVWDSPVIVSNQGGQYVSLKEVNGNPAISYANDKVRFVRAADAAGTSWGAAVAVDGSAPTSSYYTSLAVVNGNPAVSYQSVSSGDLRFTRALDANGATWGTSVVLDSTGAGQDTSTSMLVVNGVPVIGYWNRTNNRLTFIRALDANGATWDAPVTLAEGGRFNSLAVVNGVPAMSYWEAGSDDLGYIWASDAAGTSWGSPVILDSWGRLGRYNSLAEVSGNAAISYYDEKNGNLKWATFVSTPDIAVAQGGTLTDGAGSVSFGTLATGSSMPLTFTITNPGSADLANLAIIKDGTDAGSFTVTALSATTVPMGAGQVTFNVTFSPASAGAKSAAIHIASNVPGDKNPFDINLTGLALSFVDDTDGDGLNDASELQMAALGFDWQVGQPGLVTTLTSNLNGAGYFTSDQVQALNLPAPLIQRNPATGTCTITIGVEKSAVPAAGTFAPFSMITAPGAVTRLNSEGKLEFEFMAPGNAAFFKLGAQ